MPLWLQALLVVVLSVLVTLGLVRLVRSERHGYRVPGTSDPEVVYVTTLSTLYAIFLAFMIFAVWNRYYEAMEAADREANALVTIHHLARGLPQPMQGEMRRLCIRYAQTVARDEWTAMARHSDTSPTEPATRQMWALMNRVSSSNVADFVVRERILDQWVELADLRRSRLHHARTGLPGLLYAVLFLGAVVTVLTASVFAAKELSLHVLKACLLAAMISLMLFAITAIDRPYQGAVRVQADAFSRALQVMSATR